MGFGAVRYAIPFKTLFLRIDGPVSDFRTGVVEVTTEGIRITGKAVKNAEAQIPILIVTLFLRLWLIAYLLLEYAFRNDKWLTVPWRHVRQVGLTPRKRRVCLVFETPNDKGIVKTFSLAFKVPPEHYDSLVESLREFVGPRVEEVKMRSWNSPAMVMFLIGIGFWGIIFAIGSLSSIFSH
jgi:hypothetical protein